MAATPSIKVIKSMPYRGGTQLWSNRYHLSGGTVPDQTHFNTLAGNFRTYEKGCFPSYVSIVECVYYNAGSDVPVFTDSTSVAGILTPANSHTAQAGDVCALVRYSTAARSTKNHPVYLFNYYHGVYRNDATHDELEAGSIANYLALANQLITGVSDGSTTYHRAGPNGANATGAECELYLTHRDFPR